MKPIRKSGQGKAPVSLDPNAHLPFFILGHQETAAAVGRDVIVREISAGLWDHAILAKDVPRSLLIEFLGAAAVRLDHNVDNWWTSLYEDVAPALEARGASPWQADLDDRDALDQAVAIGAWQLVSRWGHQIPSSRLPLSDRTFVDDKDQVELPLLHACAKAKSSEGVKTLLSLGLDPNQPDNHGNTALFWASSEEIVSLLLDAGADVAHRNHHGQACDAFWVGARGLPLSDAGIWAKMLGERACTREDEVGDFFLAAEKMPVSGLKKLFKKVRPQKGEVNARGESVLGSASRRLLSQSRETNRGREYYAAQSWFEFVVEDPGVLACANSLDWQLLCLARGVTSGATLELGRLVESRIPNQWDSLVDLARNLDEKEAQRGNTYHWCNTWSGVMSILSSLAMLDTQSTLHETKMPLAAVQTIKSMYQASLRVGGAKAVIERALKALTFFDGHEKLLGAETWLLVGALGTEDAGIASNGQKFSSMIIIDLLAQHGIALPQEYRQQVDQFIASIDDDHERTRLDAIVLGMQTDRSVFKSRNRLRL